ncbi:MAG: glycosyltransferase family 4 protein [Lachnospiraceae bacterium]|nr:glycosyltransferase family 4 protein [Lachnospiraceae bacterium]
MKKKVLILANCASGLYDFRNELLLALLKEYEVHVSLPDEEDVPEIAGEGCKVHHTELERRGMNPLKDSKLIASYAKLMKEIRPDVVLTYTIKPNIYGSLCARIRKIPYIVNITGLGSAFEEGGMLQRIVVFLYRLALKNASCVFFQNERNREIFRGFTIRGKKERLVPGSGVNLDRHAVEEYPAKEEPVRFLFVGRIMKEKGIDEFLYAAEQMKKEYPKALFEIVGSYEDDYREIIEEKQKAGVVYLTGYQKEIHPFYQKASAVVIPSYHEGMSNVVLEASATGRPVLASDIPGCREGFEEGITGIGFAPRDKEAFLEAARKFMQLSYEERKEMGANARKKMEREFDRNIVVNAYMEEIRKGTDGRK